MDKIDFSKLQADLDGSIHTDLLNKAIYATDASVYRKLPQAVVYPKTEADINKLILFAADYNLGVIPRTAGTSLAGQCVGEGIIVDVSKHFTKILDLDVEKRQVRVQPGVIRDELNQYLEPHGLFFGPNTSTSNRCMIGGMVGNNSSGTTSIQYGVTRDKVISIKAVLSDGSTALFQPVTEELFKQKSAAANLEGKIYSKIYNALAPIEVQEEITREFPKKNIHRRNTGYALDSLIETSLFRESETDFNLCDLLCGSEGTLAFSTEITLQLDVLPPQETAMIVTHYNTLSQCLADVAPLMEHKLHLCEMMDKVILDCTKNNRAQLPNRFFVEGDPAALLMLQLRDETKEGLQAQIDALLRTIEASANSYAHPILDFTDIPKAIELRKAGLGLLGNMVGDRKAVACIEDTAVAISDLKDFIEEFTAIMDSYDQKAVYYAHAGAGELHLRPILNLKESEDVSLFRSITTKVAKLTKKYQGSFSGEHGDGIVRAEFIPMMLGENNYELCRKVKSIFDPKGIFNPGKIVDAYPMDESLRYEIDRKEPEINTLLDFSDTEGILRAAEQCNGSGDCRKTHLSKGAMCPSYQGTKAEKDTTRARANALREVLTLSDKQNRFDSEVLKEVFDLCLSCKACSSECPSNVDVATLKAEFQYQYQEANGYSLKNKLFAYNGKLNAMASMVPGIANTMFKSKVIGGTIKKIMGVAPERELPAISSVNFNKYLQNTIYKSVNKKSKVVLYIDEFTRYWDVQLGKDAIDLLGGLGYEIALIFADSGRTYLSKGFLKQAKSLAEKNLQKFKPHLEQGTPILGLEPSAILSFRDEYKRFGLDTGLSEQLASSSFLVEEFLAKEIENDDISPDQFSNDEREIKIHSHCHQKALSNQKVSFDLLNLPENYKVSIISSGCCGMAGSFGYEAEHYNLSMRIGGLSLFPAINRSDPSTVIAANGTSCRHQILDGTGRKALHPVSIMKEALLLH